jgi:hypothetical protein
VLSTSVFRAAVFRAAVFRAAVFRAAVFRALCSRRLTEGQISLDVKIFATLLDVKISHAGSLKG